MKLTFGSLFSGIGGMDLGLERAGMQCRWQVENDPYCNKILKQHWPTVSRFGDIKALDPARLEPVDLIAGGFPCQPVSLAGRRASQDDDRWLWPAFLDTIRAVGPRFVIVENVVGLLTAPKEDPGSAFGGILSDLASLGFDAEWHCLPAASAGSPQLRYRVFVVAYPQGFAERTGLCQDNPTSLWGGRLGYGSGEDCVWPNEPGLRLVADGVPDRLDRLRGLGNAVVPAVAEMVGWQLLSHLK